MVPSPARIARVHGPPYLLPRLVCPITVRVFLVSDLMLQYHYSQCSMRNPDQMWTGRLLVDLRHSYMFISTGEASIMGGNRN